MLTSAWFYNALPRIRWLLMASVLLVLAVPAQAQDVIDARLLPPQAFEQLDVVSVRDTDLRDVLRGIAESYGLNIVVDNSVQDRVTLSLEAIPIVDALRYLARQYHLSVEQTGSILRFYRAQAPPPSVPEPLVERTDSLLTVDLKGVPVAEAARLLTERTGRSIVVPQGLSGTVTAYLQSLPVEEALETIFAASGFTLAPRGRVLVVGRPGAGEAPPTAAAFYGVTLSPDSLISLNVQGAPGSALVQDLAMRLGLDLVQYASLENNVTARVRGLSLPDALDYVFQGSALTYRIDGRTLIVGRKEDAALATARLIRLEHLKAPSAFELVPAPLKQAGNVQVLPEQNALLVRGASDVIRDVARFVAEIDQPSPLVVIEALVVDFDDATARQVGLTLGRHFGTDSTGVLPPYTTQGGVSIGIGPGTVSRVLQAGADVLGLGTIGRLPSDFYARIAALETQGRARVLSRPQVATLSGQAASISVGTTQYYILRTSTPVTGGGGYVPFESERFEKVEARVSLDVTPWVSPSGEVMAHIKPEFSSPVGRFSPNVPPAINSRVLEANVRLREGETIILGGLIQDVDEVDRSGVPFLARLPLIGRLFRSSNHTRRQSELVIYLTPHIFYGDGQDAARWEQLSRRLNLTDPEAARPSLRSQVLGN